MKQQNGFTLMELIIVIVILSVLATAGFTVFATSLKRGRDARRKADLYNIKQALQMYYTDKSAYPPHVSSTDHNIGGTACNGSVCTWGTSLLGTTENPYMSKLPKDPITGWYVYTSAGGDTFTLFACLELDDPAGITVDATVCPSTKKFIVSND